MSKGYNERSYAPQDEQEWKEFWEAIRDLGGEIAPLRIRQMLNDEKEAREQAQKRNVEEEKQMEHERSEYFRKKYYEEKGIANKFVPRAYK